MGVIPSEASTTARPINRDEMPTLDTGGGSGGGSGGSGPSLNPPSTIDAATGQDPPEVQQLRSEIQNLQSRIDRLSERPTQSEMQDLRDRAGRAVQIAFRLGVQRAVNAIRQQ